jgi:ABC-2 type transport system permease protein
MTPLRHIWLVGVRDFRERLASRAFQISTGFTVLLVVGLIVAPSLFDDDGPPEWDVGYLDAAPPGFEALLLQSAADDDTIVTVTPFADRLDAETALRDGDVDLVVAGGEVLIRPNSGRGLATIVAAVVGAIDLAERAVELGISPAELAELQTAAAIDITELEERPDDEDATNRTTVALFGTIFLFISIISYGQWILVGVIEEKSSRVVEIVLGAVRPHHLLTGKVLGIGALGLAQLLLVGAIGIGMIRLSPTFELPPSAGTMAIAVVIWFLLGFSFYATAYAAAGSLVTRQEEAQNAAFPLTILLMVSYFIATFSFGGDNQILRIASLLPPFAPTTMPLRMANGDAPTWEVIFSLTLMVVTTYLLIRFAGRVYAGGLLRSGGRVKVREALRSSGG